MALALYSNDTKQKLAVYEKLDKMMIKFSSIISDLFLDKKIIFSQDQGFSFIDSDTNLELSLDKLSSGEQNIIVILYRLIFQIPENSLVLIDEPEISLHLGWQRSFLNILSEIIAINPMDIIISTHSPSIIADRRDLLVRIGKD
jgi:predicted ATP-binding protein involved in virulence